MCYQAAVVPHVYTAHVTVRHDELDRFGRLQPAAYLRYLAHAAVEAADGTPRLSTVLASAAARGAAYNVLVNVQALEDKSKGQWLAHEAQALVINAKDFADRATSIVERALSDWINAE